MQEHATHIVTVPFVGMVVYVRVIMQVGAMGCAMMLFIMLIM